MCRLSPEHLSSLKKLPGRRSPLLGLFAMGCGGSCSHTVEPAGVASVFYVPESFPKPPNKNLEPNSSTHRLYVRQLNNYLINVAKSPYAFQVQVARGRQARFGEAWAEGSMPDMLVQPGDPCCDGKWLGVGP